MRLDVRDKYPEGMEEYLAQSGWHFNKKMCDWAISLMYKEGKQPINLLSKDTVDMLLKKYNVVLNNRFGYDYIYIANMCKADYCGSSIQGEDKLSLFIKDYIDDPDGYEGLPFTRFYADCIGKGIPIMWEDMI